MGVTLPISPIHTIHDNSRDWDTLPALLTTREVADILGKSTGNVRARASKGDFGPTMPGEDGLPRYDRDRVRFIAERMAARQAQTRLVSPAGSSPADALPPALATLLTTLQTQQNEQIAFWKTRLEDALEEATQAKSESQELRRLLLEREETTRETLSHMDTLHQENIAHFHAALESERSRWESERAARDAEIERLKAECAAKKPGPQLWRK